MKPSLIPNPKRNVLLLLFMVAFSLTAKASYEINGLYYDLNTSTKTATLTYENTTTSNYSKLPKSVVIPETVEYNGSVYTVTSIANRTFANCKSLESISIPGTVETVGTTQNSGATYLPFYGCTSLKSVRFEDGNGDISLGYYNGSGSKRLFTSCPLQELYLGRNVTESSTFSEQTSLKKVTLGENVSSMPDYLFYGCSGLEYVDFGASLTSVASYAFKECSSLTSAMLPSSCKSIGTQAFRYCTQLKTVSAPGVTTIYDNAFEGNTSLSAVEFSSKLTKIAGYAFRNTTSLKSVSFPEGLISLGLNAFESSGIKEVKIPASVTSIGHYCFQSSQLESAYFGENDISLNNGVFRECKQLKSVTVASGQKSIPTSCFEGCTMLSNVTLSPGLTTIGISAFESCTSLESISIPGTVTRVGYLNSSTTYGASYLPFYGCTSLKSVRFEDGSEDVILGAYYYDGSGGGKGVFASCPLQELYLGRNVTYTDYSTSASFSSYPGRYGYSAFYNKTGLKKVTIGENVSSMPKYLFYGCTNLNTIIVNHTTPPSVGTNVFSNYNATLYYPSEAASAYTTHTTWKNFASNYAMYGEGNLIFIPTSDTEAMVARYPGASPETITIPETITFNNKNLTVTKVMEGAFAACPDLTLVKFPATLTEIGEGAFARNIKLASLTFDGQKIIGKNAFSDCTSITNLKLPNSLEEIGERAFYGNTAITSIEFGSGLKTIGSEAFAACSSLTAARMPNSLETIGNSAFENCIKLTYASLGTGLQRLNSRAFYNCKVLTDIEIPGTTRTVGEQAFENCSGLSLAILNEGIESMGGNCFRGCASLVSITIPGSMTTVGEGSFDDCTSLSTVSFAASAADLHIPYFTDAPIRTLRIGRNLKYAYGDTGSPFRNKTTITRVSFTGNYVTNIYYNLFDGCSGITSITLPATLKTINGYAFHKCTGLTEIGLPEGLTFIGNNAFENCTKLSGMTFPSTLRTIDRYAFKNCIGLAAIDVPEGVTTVGNNAFEDCTGLLEASLPSTLPLVELYLFHNCIALKQVKLKEGLQTVKSYAFDNCPSLASLTVPGTTTLIEDYAFEGCRSLAKLHFADSAEPVTLRTALSLFHDCPLETLYVGRNISYTYTTPENVPFYNQDKLTSLTFSDGEQLTTILPYFAYSASSLSSVVMPDNIQSAGKYAFADCAALESMQLSNSLPLIEEGLLKDCSSLKSLVIPASVGTVSIYALGGCSSLADLRISDSENALTARGVTSTTGMCAETGLETLYVGRDIEYTATASAGYSPFYGLKKLKAVTFTQKGYVSKLSDYYLYNCSATESLVLPESLKTIGQYALAGMTSLESCQMRNNVESIGQYGFAYDENLADLTFSTKVGTLKNNLFDGCLKLPKFTVHPAVTSIENNVFNNCQSLANFTFSDNSNILKVGRKYVGNTYYSLFADCPIEKLYLSRWLIYEIDQEAWAPFYSQTKLVDLTFGETLGDIGKYLFEKCSALQTVNIPGVESIGQKAFYECTSLNDVAFNAGTRSLGEYAFSECVALDNVKLPSTTVSISDGCFMNCTALNTLDMGTSLEIIGPSAFSGCSSLVSADIPETVYGLGVESFKGCVSLPYINVPKGISSVGARAFQGCKGAEWLTLSQRATSLGAGSFDGCTALRYIKSYNEFPPVGAPQFPYNVIDNATVFVPEVAVEDYMDADVWWEFFDIRAMSDGKFVTYLNLDTEESTLKAGGTVQLHAEAGPDDATDVSVGFVSDNASVAVVDAAGLVTATGVGEATIKAYAKDGSGYYQTCKITVIPTLVERIVLSDETMTVRVERKGTISAEVYPATATNKAFVWTSSNKGVATIDENGEITAIYDGQTTIKATAADGSNVVATCILKVIGPLPGDSNDNDEVTIADAVNTANYAVGNEVGKFNFRAADVNGDNRVTLADASGTISIILEQEVAATAAKVRALDREAEADMLVIDDYAAKVGETTSVFVSLENTADYVAMQADITVPEGMSLEAVKAGRRVEGSHSLMTKRIDSRTVRVALFDLGNNAFADNSEAILELAVKVEKANGDDIVMTNVLASDAQAKEYVLSAVGGHNAAATGLDTAKNGNVVIEVVSGAVNVYNAEGQHIDIYSVSGTKLSSSTARNNVERIRLTTGIYVVTVGDKSQKVIVK